MKRSEYEAKLNKYEEEIEELKKCIKELKNVEIEEDGFWEPGDGDSYYCIFDDGDVKEIWWRYHDVHNGRLSIGNIFKTKEEAKFEVERLKVLAELKQFSKDFKFGAYNYYLSLIMSSKCFYHNISYDIETDRKAQGVIYFESEKMAREAVKTVGEDRIKKYLFEVEE